MNQNFPEIELNISPGGEMRLTVSIEYMIIFILQYSNMLKYRDLKRLIRIHHLVILFLFCIGHNFVTNQCLHVVLLFRYVVSPPEGATPTIEDYP